MTSYKISDKPENIKKVRNDGLDKFYTIPSIAQDCINIIGSKYDWSSWSLIVEPSAGNGSFFTQIPSNNKIGLDIEPGHPDIQKCDFFKYKPSESISKNHILAIGNPPFGKVSSLAIKFFNYAGEWADVIAFIIPRTFRRISVQNKLNKYFHLVHDSEIPTNPCSFNPPMMVKCCFQIWEKRLESRTTIKLETSHPDWNFLSFGANDDMGQPTPPEGADFAIRAYGGKCGEIKNTEMELKTLRPKSWHWIKSNINKDILISRFNMLDYSNSLNTARQNSMGKGELVALYNDYMNHVETII
jgi:hypothetical protein